MITGASRGIGQGIAIEFAKQGANVAFTFNASVEAARELEKELESYGVKAKVISQMLPILTQLKNL